MSIPFPRSTESGPVPQAHAQSPSPSTSSLPSYPSSIDSGSDSDSDSDSDGDSELSDDEEAEISAMIQEEWEESLRQLEMVVSIVVMPFFGKWFGRQWSYWAWARYQRLGGLGKPFFGISS